MTHTRTEPQRPRTAPPSAAPLRHAPTRDLVAEALRRLPPTPQTPPWSHRLIPASVRGLLADLGWWTNPIPQKPSAHLLQTLDALRRYGWCRSLDVSPTGRMCIRGAQSLLEKTGHVTPAGRERAIHYVQQVLASAGITMAFFAWNDLPDQDFSAVETLLTSAAHLARQNGE